MDSTKFNKLFDEYMIRYANSPNSSIIINIYRAKLKSESKDKNYIISKLEELKVKYGRNVLLENEINRFIKRNIKHEKFWFKK